MLSEMIKEIEKRIKVIGGRFLARSTPEAVLPSSSTMPTVAPSATSVDDDLFEALIALKALLQMCQVGRSLRRRGKREKLRKRWEGSLTLL